MGRFSKAFGLEDTFNPDRRNFIKNAGIAAVGVAIGTSTLSELLMPKKALAGGLSELEQLIEGADKAFHADNYSEAISLYQKAINASAKDENKLNKQKAAELYLKMGFSFGELGNYDEGLNAYINGIKLGAKVEKFPPFQDRKTKEIYNQANDLFYQQKYEDAKTLFEIALKSEPTHPIILYQYGLCYFESGNTNEALRLYKQSIKQNPNFIQSFRGLYQAFNRLEQKKAAKLYLTIYVEREVNPKLKDKYQQILKGI